VFGKTKVILKDPFPNALNGVSRLPHWHRQSLSAYPTKIKEQFNPVLRYRGHSLLGKTRSGFFVREPELKCKNHQIGTGTMLLQMRGAKETQIRFKMQKAGEPVCNQTTIDRLWETTQREAMIESGLTRSGRIISNTATGARFARCPFACGKPIPISPKKFGSFAFIRSASTKSL